MKNARKILRILICLTLFLLCNHYKIFAENPLKDKILPLSRDASILYESSSYSLEWKAKYIIDGLLRRGWRSRKDSPFPHIIIFELISNAKINFLKFNNNTRESQYPGISSKKIQVEFSAVSPNSGYNNVESFTLEKGAKVQKFSITETKARWIRLTIKSNYGHLNYTELKEFEAWGVYEFKIFQVISNFIWILGIAIILADFSYHEFLAQLKKVKRVEYFKRDSFKKPLLLGLILIASGISASIQQAWPAAISGVVAFLLIIWFVKFIKTQATDKQKNR